MGTGWAKNEQDTGIQFQRHLGGEGVMIWAGIIWGTFIGTVRGPKVAKIILRPIKPSWKLVFSHGLTNKLQLKKKHRLSSKIMSLDMVPSNPWPS